MQQAMSDGQDAMDALLDYLAVHHRCEVTKKDEKEVVNWTSQRKTKGWIVPIATGFQGISELGQAIQQRDIDTPHRFAESVVTLGEFIMPYRINKLDNMLWHYAEVKNDLYLCQQNEPFTESEEMTHG
jgi:CRISPR-associated protein Csy2